MSYLSTTSFLTFFQDAFTSDLGAMLFNRPEYKEDIPDVLSTSPLSVYLLTPILQSIKSMSTVDEPKLDSLQDTQVPDNPEINTLNIEPL